MIEIFDGSEFCNSQLKQKNIININGTLNVLPWRILVDA